MGARMYQERPETPLLTHGSVIGPRVRAKIRGKSTHLPASPGEKQMRAPELAACTGPRSSRHLIGIRRTAPATNPFSSPIPARLYFLLWVIEISTYHSLLSRLCCCMRCPYFSKHPLLVGLMISCSFFKVQLECYLLPWLLEGQTCQPFPTGSHHHWFVYICF